MGYYPIPPEVMDMICRQLKLADKKPESTHILDPCCGQGAAVKQMADALGVPYERVYCVELDKERAMMTEAAMPGSHVLNASYLGTMITQYSFGLAYVNSPFDDELGGGKREEELFLRRATAHLVPGGVLVFVLPIDVLKKRDLNSWLDGHFDTIRIHKFQREHRHFREVVVFAVKRKVDLPADKTDDFGEMYRQGWRWGYQIEDHSVETLGRPHAILNQSGQTRGFADPGPLVFEVRWSLRPHTFKKITMTAEELQDYLRESPLNRLMTQPVIPAPKRPPLPLGRGHVGLLLASGELNGVVSDGAYVHVVRGTSVKERYVSSVTVTENEDGSATEKVVESDRIVMTIRAVDENGVIRTFSDRPAQADGLEADPDTDDSVEVKATTRESPGQAKAIEDISRGSVATAVAEMQPEPESCKETGCQSWKAGFITAGDTSLSFNSLRFAFREDAERYARDLAFRWTAVKSWELVESEDDPNR